MAEAEKESQNEAKLPYGISKDTYNNIINALELEEYKLAASLISELHYADIADLIETVSQENKIKILESLKEEFDPNILVELDNDLYPLITEIIGEDKIAHSLAKLESDEIIYVIEDLSQEEQEKILSYFPESKKAELKEGLSYPENSAGRIMQKEIVSVPVYWTVGQIVDYCRQHSNLPEDFYEIFIVDHRHRPVGGIVLSRILRSKRESYINDIMSRDIHTLSTDLDQEEVSYIFKQYNLTSAPVTNKEGKLVGVINIDDIVEVIEEEAEEDLMKIVGVNETDIFRSFFSTAKGRFPWLFCNLIIACITSSVINFFQNTLHHMIALAAIMPIVSSMGGNSGTQTLTVSVRALASKELTAFNATRVIIKEIFASALNGVFLAVLGAFIILLWYKDSNLSIIFALSIIINFSMAGFFGSVIPLLLNKLKIDPAIASSVFLTAITDMVGFLSFLALATVILL